MTDVERISQREATESSTDCAVLFSGGRDSTLASLLSYRTGSYLHLLSFDTGLGYGGSKVRELRLQEMRVWWGAHAFENHTIPIHGLVRQLCFANLVDDILVDRRQLILLGEFMAMLAAAIVYCRSRGLAKVVFGATDYQSYLPEQQPKSLELFADICDCHGLELLTPVRRYDSDMSVKVALLEAGLMAKSLEGATLLADLDDSPPTAVVEAYIKRKLPQVNQLISRNERRG